MVVVNLSFIIIIIYLLFGLSDQSVSAVFGQHSARFSGAATGDCMLNLCNCENLSCYRRVTQSRVQECLKTCTREWTAARAP